jgi:hypothetical protein
MDYYSLSLNPLLSVQIVRLIEGVQPLKMGAHWRNKGLQRPHVLVVPLVAANEIGTGRHPAIDDGEQLLDHETVVGFEGLLVGQFEVVAKVVLGFFVVEDVGEEGFDQLETTI